MKSTKEKYMEFVAQCANKHDDYSMHVAVHFNGAHDVWPLIEPLLKALKQTVDESNRDYKFAGVTASEAIAEFDKAIGGWDES